MRFYRLIVGLLLLAPATALAGSVTIEAARDATLIETPDGSLANGSGPALFAGRTNQDEYSRRRGLVYFDIAGALPEDAEIVAVRLTMYLNPSQPAERAIRLHRVQAAWSEGPAVAGGGGGAPSAPGDVTWIHTSYDDRFWVRPGGHFLDRASAETNVSVSDHYVWEGGHLLQDVRLWKQNPRRNHGWILIGDEEEGQSAKSFASRESTDPSIRPVLEIAYR